LADLADLADLARKDRTGLSQRCNDRRRTDAARWSVRAQAGQPTTGASHEVNHAHQSLSGSRHPAFTILTQVRAEGRKITCIAAPHDVYFQALDGQAPGVRVHPIRNRGRVLDIAIPRVLAIQGTSKTARAYRLLTTPFARVWQMAEAHQLNPWYFIIMSCVGWSLQLMMYLPPFQGQAARLTFLILLRLVALVIPTYILLRGKGIAMAFNASISVMFLVNTAWHVCYYVYL